MKSRKKIIQKRLVRGVASAIALYMSGTLLADTSKLNLNIESQKVGPAMMGLAVKTNSHIVFPKNIGENLQLPSLKGDYTLSAALDEMLNGTGLIYEFVTDESVLIKQGNVGDRKTLSPQKEENSDIEEIIITATKRATSLQDAAISIAAIGSEEIDRRGIVSMEDYLKYTPGVSQIDRGVGNNSIIIRGLATNPNATGTVGAYFGQTPVNSGGFGTLDLKVVDVDHVEILRGPQSTLYGASAVGGVIRTIPNAPNLNELEGKIETSYSNTARAGSDNNMIQGVINVPLIEDTLAVRAVLYRFDNSGYIENVAGSDPDKVAFANSFGAAHLAQNITEGASDYAGGRFSVLWQPTEDLDVTASYIRQDLEQTISPFADTALPRPYQINRLQLGNVLPEYNGVVSKAEVFGVDINYDFGWASLNSSTSFLKHRFASGLDVSYILGYPGDQINDRKAENVVEEIRLTSQHDGPLQYMVGFYYEDAEDVNEIFLTYSGDLAFNPTPTVPVAFGLVARPRIIIELLPTPRSI